MIRVSIALLALFASANLVVADDITLKSVRFGDPIQGGKLSADNLKGQVVLVELWGIN
ncbi:MAG: hypothetical protein MUF18_10630 [Fimbriiglobus sp.]|nr:hypothetical protein [Fimbriiglobus sp.]